MGGDDPKALRPYKLLTGVQTVYRATAAFCYETFVVVLRCKPLLITYVILVSRTSIRLVFSFHHPVEAYQYLLVFLNSKMPELCSLPADVLLHILLSCDLKDVLSLEAVRYIIHLSDSLCSH